MAGLSLKEDLVELSLSIDAILTQTIAAFVNSAKKRTVDDDLAHLISLFSNTSDSFKKMVRQVNFRHDKEKFIKELENALHERSEFLSDQAGRLTEAFKMVSKVHFNGQKALKKARVQCKSFEPEEVLRMSHLISKNFSVASPHFWQQGDPMRPYPTELNFRISAFGNAEGIKDAKELSVLPLSAMPSTYDDFSNDVNGHGASGNPVISSTSFLPSNFEDDTEMDLILPGSSTSIADKSTSNHEKTYNSGLMSSDEDESDEGD